MARTAATEGSGRIRPAVSLRADAERNRGRIIDAARRLYAGEGLGVSMAAVAREAGLGKATLSRHFATPQQLIHAVFADRMDAYVAAAAAALDEEDAWLGFVHFVVTVCEMQAQDRGFAAILTLSFPATTSLEERRAEAHHAFLEIIARAKASGQLRSDFASEDLVLLLMANAGVVVATAQDAPDSWRRFVWHVLRGFASPNAPIPPIPAAPSSDDLYRAMARAAHPKVRG